MFLLPQILQAALDNLPIAKRMRSAASRTEFVRPVKWVVLLKDSDVIECNHSGSQSRQRDLWSPFPCA